MKLYVLCDDKIRGPFEQEQIVAWRKINILNGDSLVRPDKVAADWVKLDSIIEKLPATVDSLWNDATALLRPEKQAKQTNNKVEIASVGSTSAHTIRSASAVASFLNYLKRRPGILISTSFVVLLFTFLISWSFPLSVTILIIFLLPCVWLVVMAISESFLLCVVAFAFFIGVLAIGLKYLDYRFPERGIDRSPIASDSPPKTDGVFESATEKLDKGLPLNEREQKRIYDILTYDDKKKAEEIEKRNGERR